MFFLDMFFCVFALCVCIVLFCRIGGLEDYDVMVMVSVRPSVWLVRVGY